ncbi:snake venom 5'-nucleotidase-like [Genypterus blacodes]|uniref:snake venom 5'-nucleotidase-like n=1 Tax=Genypterus blacodes TaxID=154954 RepID=UPI003F7636B3
MVRPRSAALDLVLLHTNDVHARVEETNKRSGKCTADSGSCFAGVARRATMIKKIRASETNVLLLDAGGQFQGTVWFNYYKGAGVAHFMNNLSYDAMAFGNHEFDKGLDGLMKPFLQDIKFAVLSANIKTDNTLAATFGTSYSPYKIFTFGKEKVGVVGYTTEETPALSKPGPHLVFEDEVKALQVQVDKLQTLGVNKIIALGHSGFTMDYHYVRELKEIDLRCNCSVLCGHTSAFKYLGSPPSSEVPDGPYPFIVKSEDGRDVPVVQAYAFGKYLGFLKVSFDEAGNVVTSKGNPILLDGSVKQDPVVLAEVEQWKKALANFSSQVVGKTLVYLNGSFEECRFRECNLGNLICDAMVQHNIRTTDEHHWSHVSACFMNAGGIRSSIDERKQNGSISLECLSPVMPFEETVDLVQLNGSTLKKVFEHSVRRYGQGTGEFLQVSGFHVEFDMSKDPQQRVRTLTVLCTDCGVPRYEPVQDEKVYTVVMPSFMANGGDGYSMIEEERLKYDTGELDISVVANYITERKAVFPGVEVRIMFTSAAAGLQGRTSSLVLLGIIWTLCCNI